DRYCGIDVDVECAADKRLPPLSATERRVWILDQHINERGVALDVARITRADAAVQEAVKRADPEMWRLTARPRTKCSQVARIVTWLNSSGVECESIGKGEEEELMLKTALLDDPVAEQVVRLRRAAGKSSTSKYRAMLNCVMDDGRARGALTYHKAS